MMLKKKNGFTVVEIMVALVIGSVIMMVAGTLLYQSYVHWADNVVDVDLQRDATFAMDLMARAVRQSTSSQVTVAGGGEALTAGITSFVLNGDGDTIIYTPDTTDPNPINLATDRVNTLSFTLNADTVDIQFVLQDGARSMTVNSEIAFRN